MTRSVGVVLVLCGIAAAVVACGAEPAPTLVAVVPPPQSARPSASPLAAEEPPPELFPVAQPARCSADNYCWENPFPGAGALTAMWAAGENDLYFVVEHDRIMHFDGASWRFEWTPGNVYLTCLGGGGPGDLLAAGAGVVLRRQGGVWRALEGAGDMNFEAVWGDASGDVFAAGNGSTIAHHDGRQWYAEPLGQKATLTAFWGNGVTDLYAVGSDDNAGVVVHRDAAGWKALPNVGKSLVGVWGTGPDAVWVAGLDEREKLAAWRLSGSQWKTEAVPAGGEPRGLSGTGGTPVLLGVEYLDSERKNMGPTSVFLARPDGGRWSTRELLLTSPLISGASWKLQSDARGGLFLGGGWGVVGAIEANGFRALSGNAALGKDLTGVWGTSPSDVVAVGAEEALLRYDGTSWSPDLAGRGLSFTGIHGAKAILAASALGGKLLVRKAGVWTALATGTTKDLFAVWTDGDEVFAGGEEGTLVRCVRERCAPMKTGIDDAIRTLAGRSAKELYAATAGDTLLRFEGVTWNRVRGPGEPGVEVIDANKGGRRHEDWVLHIGAMAPDPGGGMIIERTDGSFRVEGDRWTRLADGGAIAITDGSSGELRAVYGGVTDGTRLRVRRFDGQGWQDEELPAQELDGALQHIAAIWSGGGEVFLVGDGGIILHRKP